MTLADYLAAGAILVAVPATWAGWFTWRAARNAGGKDGFRAQLESLQANQMKLTRRMLAASPAQHRRTGIPMLIEPEWAEVVPFDLADLEVEWRDDNAEFGDLERFRRAAARVIAGVKVAPITRYSTAMVEIAGMRKLFDGVVYRLVDVDLSSETKRMVFTKSSYFAYLDTCEVLAFEAQLRQSVRWRPSYRRLSYRRQLRDPFDFRNRVASLGIDTMTIRRDGDRAGFFLLQRDPKYVVNNASLLGVIPSGEFTPSDVSSEAVSRDLDLWKNIMREFAEEMLGVDDAQGQGGKWIDYVSGWPYRELEHARATGRLQVKVLGLGVDPLPWKPELLTVCVIDADVFDEIFAPVPPRNDEGIIIAGDGTGLSFDAATIDRYCRENNVSPNTEACLRLAWKHRTELGLA